MARPRRMRRRPAAGCRRGVRLASVNRFHRV